MFHKDCFVVDQESSHLSHQLSGHKPVLHTVPLSVKVSRRDDVTENIASCVGPKVFSSVLSSHHHLVRHCLQCWPAVTCPGSSTNRACPSHTYGTGTKIHDLVQSTGYVRHCSKLSSQYNPSSSVSLAFKYHLTLRAEWTVVGVRLFSDVPLVLANSHFSN